MTDTPHAGIDPSEWERLLSALRECEDFVLFAHVSPDGDAIGSTIALALLLERLGKRVRCVCDGDVPPPMRNLPSADRCERFNEAMCKESRPASWAAIAVDCADRSRLGAAIALFDSAPIRVVVDHHVSNEGFAEVNVVDGTAAATAEIIARIADDLSLSIEGDTAVWLYIAIVSDTGNFAYSNTTGRTMRLAARLIESGIDMWALQRQVFATRSLDKTRLISLCLQGFSVHYGGKLALRIITGEELKANNLLTIDSNGVIEFLRDIEGVEIAVYARQLARGCFKVSMRSVERVDVAAIAARFEGGGHIRAAGFTWRGEDPETLRKQVIAMIGAELGMPEESA